MEKAVTSTAVIAILVLLGFFSRKWHILREGDERVLNAFVYYFAFPAFLVFELSQTRFNLETVRFLAAGAGPMIALIFVFLGLSRLSPAIRARFHLFSVATVFGSLGFFGIPFVEVVLGPGEAVRLSVAFLAALAPFSVGLVLALLELHNLNEPRIGPALAKVLRRFSRNPLIIAILIGLALSFSRLPLPVFLHKMLSVLGGSTVPVALFSLGVFLYGRKIRKLLVAAALTILRLVILPALTLTFARFLRLAPEAQEVAVIMSGTPLAVNMVVLSARYNFFPEEIATFLFLSSLASLFTMTAWSAAL